MLKLLEESTYDCCGLRITVTGVTCEQLSKIYPICAAMNRRVKEKTLEIAKNEELIEIFRKVKDGEPLKDGERVILHTYEVDTTDNDFSLEESKSLVENYLDCIIKVTKPDSDEDLTTEFKGMVLDVPKQVKALANLVYAEFKNATEVSAVKKL